MQGQLHLCGKNEVRPLLHTIHKNQLQINHRPNRRNNTIKFLKGNIYWLDKAILGTLQKVQGTKEKINKLNFIKIKCLCTLKNTIKKAKDCGYNSVISVYIACIRPWVSCPALQRKGRGKREKRQLI